MNRSIDAPPGVAPAPGAEPGTLSVSPPPEWLIVGLDVPGPERARTFDTARYSRSSSVSATHPA